MALFEPKLHLYDNNLASPTLIETYGEESAALALIHSTVLHGGYGEMMFQVQTSEGLFWEYYLNREGYRLLLEYGDDPLWEGRIIQVQQTENKLLIKALGYWHHLTQRYVNFGAAKVYTAQNADVIIKDLLTNYTADINSDQSNIASPGIAMTKTLTNLTVWDAITDPTSGIAGGTDANSDPWFFAIWHGKPASNNALSRLPYFKVRDLSTIHWNVLTRNISPKPQITLPAGWRRTRVITHYLVAGVDTWTAAQTDTNLEATIGRREVLISIGTSDVTTANNQRDRIYAERRNLRVEMPSSLSIANLFDRDGVEQPPCKIRAGDILRINDLIPATAGLDAATQNGLNTFLVRKTRCDHIRGVVDVELDLEDTSLIAKLRQARLLPRGP